MPQRPRLTPAVIQDIASFIRAGGFPHVAAEAAGIPQALFARWMETGRRDGVRKRYRDLRKAVLQAQAQARLKAEIAAFTDKPLDWLRSGPGKPTADAAGWTGPARASREEGRPANPLLDQAIQELLQRVLGCLEAFPDARSRIAAEIAHIMGDPAAGPSEENGTT